MRVFFSLKFETLLKVEEIEITNMHVETTILELTILLTHCTAQTTKVNTTIVARSFLKLILSPQSRTIVASIKAYTGR